MFIDPNLSLPMLLHAHCSLCMPDWLPASCSCTSNIPLLNFDGCCQNKLFTDARPFSLFPAPVHYKAYSQRTVTTTTMCLLQQLGVNLGHVITFSEPAPDVSVPTPLATNTRTLGNLTHLMVVLHLFVAGGDIEECTACTGKQ